MREQAGRRTEGALDVDAAVRADDRQRHTLRCELRQVFLRAWEELDGGRAGEFAHIPRDEGQPPARDLQPFEDFAIGKTAKIVDLGIGGLPEPVTVGHLPERADHPGAAVCQGTVKVKDEQWVGGADHGWLRNSSGSAVSFVS